MTGAFQMWEYSEVQLDLYEHPLVIFQARGDLGWELVSVTDDYAYFKRPKIVVS